eukprot:scaffold56774_cov67-Phaeocystis_antarctica.AAC.2
MALGPGPHTHGPREDTELSRCVPNLPQPGERCREGGRGGSRGGRIRKRVVHKGNTRAAQSIAIFGDCQNYGLASSVPSDYRGAAA